MSSELRVLLAAATLALWLALVLFGLIWEGRVHALWLVILALIPWRALEAGVETEEASQDDLPGAGGASSVSE